MLHSTESYYNNLLQLSKEHNIFSTAALLGPKICAIKYYNQFHFPRLPSCVLDFPIEALKPRFWYNSEICLHFSRIPTTTNIYHMLLTISYSESA